MNLFETIMDDVSKTGGKQVVAVAKADEQDVLFAIKAAMEHEIAKFLLFGNVDKMKEIANQIALNLTDERIKCIFSEDEQQAAMLAVQAVNNGEADVVMKGNLPSNVLLKEVLHKDYGIKGKGLLSHIAAFAFPAGEQFLFVTDAGMNIQPSLEEKVQIIQNAAKVVNSIGVDCPKIAVLAAVEVVNPKMPATLDAAILTQMQKRGQISDCIVDGPLAFDNAISEKAAKQKNVHSEVAGHADILLVPTIETGNSLYKSFVYYAQAKVAAFVTGGKAPIVLTSRADSAESKLYSLALALQSTNAN
ncbi:bifunctional enoyl-CoA hydratase/phosphate acetyltransferase [Salirhabdus salicampi]|uniref:bifunctional enoyl-CoA hydratase/phosphate acetyltransferase n=1 Tax=Salirhabdus salicampi TaxID=476102 RepID=UPI0020C25332|nr:bifunctional enoyl-CoA hydratase/phosphate acetyltransferase [Salirhabdus salicampi]MCP8616801.1 bifunctional enoyl-CoA hydratase/phosphate acetyltransferase [Salirhabdus salicampi]